MEGRTNTVVNGAMLNNGLVLHGSSSNTVTNDAGATINRQFDIDGHGLERSPMPARSTLKWRWKAQELSSIRVRSAMARRPFNGHSVRRSPGTVHAHACTWICDQWQGSRNGRRYVPLGGTGTRSFQRRRYCSIRQYRGLDAFRQDRRISPELLTGSGGQSWTITGGTLIGDTNNLNGDTITNASALVFSIEATPASMTGR